MVFLFFRVYHIRPLRNPKPLVKCVVCAVCERPLSLDALLLLAAVVVFSNSSAVDMVMELYLDVNMPRDDDILAVDDAKDRVVK